ncbi:hypothetical protein [Bremerella sp.]|uniref:hypothetical protein n=1 Tax=Bremerella sp. TaxID=2795602 RepID=UPI003919BA12
MSRLVGPAWGVGNIPSFSVVRITMTTQHRQPESSGATEPQVVVRAGKYYVCSACGTMVELPDEVVGQLVLAAAPTQEPAAQKSPAAASQASDRPSAKVDRRTPATTTTPPVKSTLRSGAPLRPRRPQAPRRESFVNMTIDGLRVPSAQQLDRALAWVSFHLRVLDRQGSEIKRLKKLLKEQSTDQVPRPSPLGREKTDCVPESHAPGDHQPPRHAHEDVSMAPKLRNKTERGPP